MSYLKAEINFSLAASVDMQQLFLDLADTTDNDEQVNILTNAIFPAISPYIASKELPLEALQAKIDSSCNNITIARLNEAILKLIGV